MEISSSVNIDEFADDASSFSDHKYAEELQLLEALEASLNISSTIHETPSSSSQASTSSQIISCEICTEDTERSEMFQLEGCPHSYCFVCISKHVAYKLQENIIFISCPDPDCTNRIEPESLRFVIPPDVIDRWEKVIAESTIPASQKVHCPFEECSEIFVEDEGIVTQCECPMCHRLFCAKCRVPWHQGLNCIEFQSFNQGQKEERYLRLLAAERKWKECPNCKVFVDKNQGCMHITCRCGFQFCYACGTAWSSSHSGCR